MAGKLGADNPKGAIEAYNTAAAADEKPGGGLSSFISGKISGLRPRTATAAASRQRPAAHPTRPSDGQADQMLSQARTW